MSDHSIAPGFTLKDVHFDTSFAPISAQAKAEDWGNSDPFTWRIVVGRVDPSKGGQPAFTSTCSFVPQGAPGGTTYGIKQIAFHKFLSIFYSGRESAHGSIVMGTTSVNFAWHLDVTGSLSASGFSAPSLPFFLENAKAVANGGKGSIKVIDSPGGTARLVRPNLVTGKRNFLRSYASETTFITMLTVVMPDARHIPVRAVAWNFATEAKVTWDSADKPSLAATGRCSFDSLVDADMLHTVQRQLLEDNSLGSTDTILFKVNNGLTNAEIQDAKAGVATGSHDDRRFGGGTFEIIHSERQQK